MLYPPFYGSKDVFYHILSPAKLPYAFLWGRPQMRGLKLFLDRPMFRFRPLQTDRWICDNGWSFCTQCSRNRDVFRVFRFRAIPQSFMKNARLQQANKQIQEHAHNRLWSLAFLSWAAQSRVGTMGTPQETWISTWHKMRRIQNLTIRSNMINQENNI